MIYENGVDITINYPSDGQLALSSVVFNAIKLGYANAKIYQGKPLNAPPEDPEGDDAAAATPNENAEGNADTTETSTTTTNIPAMPTEIGRAHV